MTDFNIEHTIKQEPGTVPEMIIRKGEAAKVQEPKSIVISGVIDSPFRWLAKRAETFHKTIANIIVDRYQMAITLTINEGWPVNTVITGKLELHPVFVEFGINNGTYRSTLALAEFFKYKRKFFANHSEAMKIVTALKDFKGKVSKQVEIAGDVNKGDKRILIDQVVNNNLPATFELKIPVFKGTPAQVFPVELMFNPDDLTCAIVSPEAADIAEGFRDTEIDKQVANLDKFDIVIIEV